MAAVLAALKEFYGRAVTRAFWFWGGAIYTIVPGRHIGADWGKLGYFTDVPALCGGRVVKSFTSPILGGVVVVATGLPGNYAHITYCHLFDGDMLRYGAVVTQGQRVGRLAKNGESHGTAWTGEHCHVVCSRNANGAYWKSPSNVAETYSDPAVLAATVLADFSAAESKPLIQSEDDMTQSITVAKKHQYAVGEEFLSHYATPAQQDITRKVTSGTDEMHQLSETDFWNLLDGLGIPRQVVDLKTGAVLNPQSGKFEGGGVWSRRREAVAKLDQLLAKTAGK